jgi:hypothetical protein
MIGACESDPQRVLEPPTSARPPASAPAAAQTPAPTPPPAPPHDIRANPGSSEDPGGARVTASTRLAPGDTVYVEWNEKWYAGEIVSLFPDGSVRVHYVGWAPSWDAVAVRSRLRLPEPEE